MVRSFTPPGLKSLAEVDVAHASYESMCTVIEGVVSPSSQGGWPGGNDGYEVHCFALAGWRCFGDTLVKRELTILRPIPPEDDWRGAFPALSIQRMSVLLSKDRSRAVFEKALPLDEPDEELANLATELRKPVVISTATFGDLVLDRRIGLFEGAAQWNGKTVAIHLHADGANAIDSALQTAQSLWADQAQWKQRVDEFAVRELLSLKNDNWLEEDERPLNEIGRAHV